MKITSIVLTLALSAALFSACSTGPYPRLIIKSLSSLADLNTCDSASVTQCMTAAAIEPKD